MISRLRLLVALFLTLAAPSAPVAIRARAALTPAPGVRGEARPGVGHPDMLLNWKPEPDHRLFLSDAYLDSMVEHWREQLGAGS